jgi:long-chain acyl-CoA synthetase
LGIYRERSWCDYARLVAHYAHALQSIGLERGERAAIMGDVCEEWLLCDLAVQSLGAIAYGIYPTAAQTEVEYQMRDGGAAFFIAEDQEYVDKISPSPIGFPDLKAIVVIDDLAMFGYTHPCSIACASCWTLQTNLSSIAGRRGLLGCRRKIRPLSSTRPAPRSPERCARHHGRHLAATDTVVTQYPTLRESLTVQSFFCPCVMCSAATSLLRCLSSRG